MSFLEVKNLKTYFFTRWGTVKAVDGVSFCLNEGEALGLVGESGCGKSVTSLSILRLVPQPAGRIIGGQVLLQGEDLLQKSEKEMRRIRGARISMILQDPMSSLNPVFTIENQLGESLQIHRGLKGRGLWERAVEMLKMVRIASPEVCLKNWPHQLSGGMRQRVVAAIALSCEPHLLIADEPTTALDATIQVQFLRLLSELQRKTGLTLVFVTHDFGIVARMCNRVGVMYAGKIVEMADVRTIFDQPAHPYTQALMKAVPNIDEEEERLISIDGQPPPLHNLPPGCVFASRCSSVSSKCRYDEYPPTVELGNGHTVSCWKHV
ncbi:MAG: ABC transporter ATP-binding protein [Deltaproteobacteria bacterium]|nr:MAG: ABC transporter ATP-binding protein [Deltaproteobacteria bacterium]